MCIIIAKPAGVERLNPDYFDRAWTRNPDGGGLVWKEKDGEVTMQKGFMKKEDFLAKIDELNQKDTAFIAHFRIKSVGAVCAENTHPFVFDHVTYAHNGTLSIKPFDGKTDSETFGLCFLKDKTLDWIKEYQVLLEMALGTSKFAIMDNETGEIFILNSDYGKERDGAWFSNESAFQPVTPVHKLPRDNGYDPYSGCYPYKTYSVKGVADWGTRRFQRAYAYIGDNNVWHYTSIRTPIQAQGYPNVRIHKRGFWIIDPTIPVPKEAEDKTYNKNSLEVKAAEKLQRTLYKSVDEYHKTTFDETWDRDEAEAEMSAVYTVIKVMYAFIHAKKKIDKNEFLSFLLDNTESDTWVTKHYAEKAYQEYVELYANEVVSDLEKAYAKKA